MEKRCKKNSRGLSPVVATVLLVAMVVIIGLIIFLWLKGLTREQITKFGGTNIEIVCDDVYFEAGYSSNSNTLSILNSGNVPIYNFKIKINEFGSYYTKNLGDISSEWETNFKTGLNSGGVFSDDNFFIEGESIVVIPVLIGESDKGKKTYTCNEELQGYEIIL